VARRLEDIRMNGYLTFLKSLSQSQQRALIGRSLFIAGWMGTLEEDLLKAPAVAAFSKSLGVDPRVWQPEPHHYAEELDLIGTPVFGTSQCRAPFNFRYVAALRSLDRVYDDLVISGMIYIDDDQGTMIQTLAASATREPSCARERLTEMGINPDTWEIVAHDAAMASKMPYLKYLEALLPQQRREAIFELADQAWRQDNPLFMDHPALAPELARLKITHLGVTDFCHMVGPVEFCALGQCTATITYPLYGGGDEDNTSDGYYAEIDILASIGNRPGGGGDIRIQDLWFRIESIDDLPSETSDPLLVP
jgi:hypothetical protein